MRLLQLGFARFHPNAPPDGATIHLLNRLSETDGERLSAAIRKSSATRAKHPKHYGLAFALGLAFERLATLEPWDRRSLALHSAVSCYEDALGLADRGETAGASLLSEVTVERWESGLRLEQRAVLAAAFAAGLLRAGEFRVRDPKRGATLLRRVVESLRGYHPAWYYLGEAYLLADEFDAAECAWREGFARNPEEGALLTVLDKLPVDRVHHQARRNDWPGVLHDIARLPPGRMPESERLTIEGDAYRALGELERARSCWEAALRADSLAVGVRKRLYQLDPEQAGASEVPPSP